MPSRDSRAYEVIDQLADEFAARYRRGERPSLQEFIDRHPDLADDIRELLPAMIEIEQAKADVQPEEGESAVAAPPLQQMGDYHLLREIGRGGMGVVYEAEQLSLSRRVALKILPQKMFPDARQKRRFEREARAAARLHHTNIVPIFGVGETEGLPYYVMQFIQGLGLDQVIEELQRMHGGSPESSQPASPAELHVRRKDVSVANMARSLVTGVFQPPAPDSSQEPSSVPAHQLRSAVTIDLAPDPSTPDSRKDSTVTRHSDTFTLTSADTLPNQSSRTDRRSTYWQSVARIGEQVASALSYAHQQGVLHRDIKPGNLLLDTRGTVWVTDFGLAKAEGTENLTHTGDILGTVRYMPPEAFDGHSEPRSDVYALGLTLYELLALRPAFDEKERNKLIRQVTTSEAPRLDTINPAIPRDLVTIVHKAIEKDPDQRYASAEEMEEDLQRFLNDEPIRARRVSSMERLMRWAKHNRGLAAALSAVALLLLIVAVGSSLAAVGWMHIADQKSELAEAREVEREKAVVARNDAERDQKEAERQRKLAEDNAAQARKAVDEYLKAGQEMVKVPGLAPVGEELLRSALKFYEGYLRNYRDDPNRRADLASAYLKVGDIYRALRDSLRARNAYTDARVQFEELARTHPDDADIQGGLAQSLANLGQVNEAIAIWMKLIQPDKPRFQAELASAYNSHAVMLTEFKKNRNKKIDPTVVGDALKAHEEALTIRKRLVELDPNNVEYRRDLGQTLNNMAVLLSNQMRKYEEAVQMYRSAAVHARAAYEKAPNDLQSGRFLAISLRNVSIMERSLGQEKQAVQSLQESIAVLQKLARDFYAVAITHRDLYTYSLELSRLQKALGDKQGVERSLFLARSALARLPRNSPDELIELAAVHALSASAIGGGKANLTVLEKAEQQKEIDQAMDALKKALAKGYENVEFLKTNRDLDGLRPREDFKELISALDVKVTASLVKRANIEKFTADLRAAEALVSSDKISPQEQLRAHEKVIDLRQKLADLGQSSGTLQSDVATSRHAAGLIQLGLGQLESAEKTLKLAQTVREELVKKYPKNHQYRADLASSHLGLGECYLKSNRLADAAKSWQAGFDLLKEVVRATPKDSPFASQLAAAGRTVGYHYMRLGLWEEGAEHHGWSFAQDSSLDTTHWRTQALLLLLTGDNEGYRRLCQRMAKQFTDPSQEANQFAPHNLTTTWSMAAGGTDDPERVVKLTREYALARKDGHRWPWFYYALACYRAKQYTEAQKELNFDWYQGYPLRAMLSFQLGKKDDVQRWLARTDDYYHKALTQSLREPDKEFMTGINTNFQDRLQFLILRQEAHRLINGKPPADPQEQLYRAGLYTRFGSTKQAEARIKSALAAQPSDVSGWLLRGRAFQRIGRDDLARSDFDSASKLKSTDPRPWIEHGHYLVGRGENKDADVAYAQAAKLSSDSLYHFPQSGWWVVGSYPRNLELTSPPTIFADPSKPAPSFDSRKALAWQQFVPNEEGTINLNALGSDNRCAFALTHVYSPDERSVLLMVGGADRVHLWLNGRLVHELTRREMYAWNTDLVPVTLRAGRNTLLARVEGSAGAQPKSELALMLRIADNPMDRGHTLSRFGLWKDALTEYDRVYANRQSLPSWTSDTWGHYAICCVGAGDTDRLRRIRADLLGALVNSNDQYAKNVLALALVATPDFDVKPEALHRFAEPAYKPHAWRPFVQSVALYRTKQYEKAIEIILDHKELSNPHPSIPYPHALLAMAYHQLGKQEAARASLTKLEAWYDELVKRPTDFDAPVFNPWMLHLALNVIFYREAKLLIDKKDLKDDPRWKAVQDYNRKWLKNGKTGTMPYDLAVTLSYNHPRLLLARALYHAEHKRNKEADADFDKAVTLQPADPQVWKGRGLVYTELKRFDEAAADFVEGLKLAPPVNPVRWWDDPTGIYSSIVSSDEVFARVQRLRPDDHALLMIRLRYLGSHARWDSARDIAPPLMRLTPVSFATRYDIAALYLEAQDRGRYRRVCQDMLGRVGVKGNPQEAQQTALSCLLLPQVEGGSPGVYRIAEMIKADADKNPFRQRLNTLTLALAELRIGNADKCIATVSRLKLTETGGYDAARGFALLALAHQQRNQKDEARQALTRARAILETRWKQFEQGRLFGNDSHNWLRSRILVREAESAIKGKKPD